MDLRPQPLGKKKKILALEGRYTEMFLRTMASCQVGCNYDSRCESASFENGVCYFGTLANEFIEDPSGIPIALDVSKYILEENGGSQTYDDFTMT